MTGGLVQAASRQTRTGQTRPDAMVRADRGSGAAGRSDSHMQVAGVEQAWLAGIARRTGDITGSRGATAVTLAGAEQQPHFAAVPHCVPSAITIEQAEASRPANELPKTTPRVIKASRSAAREDGIEMDLDEVRSDSQAQIQSYAKPGNPTSPPSA